MRSVESSVSTEGLLKPFDGWTNKFIFSPYEFSVANCMITNFHLPYSTQLMMVAAFAGYDALMSARPYKPAFSSEKAIQMILNGECGVFNPVLVDCLLEVVSQQKTGKEGTPPPKNLSTAPGGSVLNTLTFSGSVM